MPNLTKLRLKLRKLVYFFLNLINIYFFVNGTPLYFDAWKIAWRWLDGLYYNGHVTFLPQPEHLRNINIIFVMTCVQRYSNSLTLWSLGAKLEVSRRQSTTLV